MSPPNSGSPSALGDLAWAPELAPMSVLEHAAAVTRTMLLHENPELAVLEHVDPDPYVGRVHCAASEVLEHLDVLCAAIVDYRRALRELYAIDQLAADLPF